MTKTLHAKEVAASLIDQIEEKRSREVYSLAQAYNEDAEMYIVVATGPFAISIRAFVNGAVADLHKKGLISTETPKRYEFYQDWCDDDDKIVN